MIFRVKSKEDIMEILDGRSNYKGISWFPAMFMYCKEKVEVEPYSPHWIRKNPKGMYRMVKRPRVLGTWNRTISMTYRKYPRYILHEDWLIPQSIRKADAIGNYKSFCKLNDAAKGLEETAYELHKLKGKLCS